MLQLPEEELAKIASTIPAGSKIKDAISLLARPYCRGLVVVDSDTRALGVVQLEDVRRSALAGGSAEAAVEEIMRPVALGLFDGSRPTDEIFRLLGLGLSSRGYRKPVDSPRVVILAGGEGRRLRPLTGALPKPLLPVSGSPLLEITMKRLADFGLNDITVAIHYLGDMIEAHFGSGTEVGVQIKYVREQSPLGTAGGIRLAMAEDPRRALVLNGDILTALHYRELLEHHQARGNSCTVCVKLMDVPIPYGVLELNGLDIVAIREKPIKRFLVSAGIYVLEPNIVNLIPFNRRFDMTDVIATAVAKGFQVGAFPIVEYWQDIGQVDDYKSANLAYAEYFNPRGKVEASWTDQEP